VTLELMADPSGGVLEARNTRFEANWGDPTTLGKLVTQPVTLNEEARTVRLSWNGTGVSFMVSTDNGKTWESVANGKATVLKSPGNRLVLKAMLQMAATTQLDSYSLEVNPANFSLFTGKMLTEETGLVYFGARWYDPEIGRFISHDPEEDGENWYSYCENDPINYVDPDGRLSLRGWGILWGGLKLGFKQYALKTAADVATGIVIGSAMAVCMPAIMPTLPAAIPIIVATATYIGIACDIGPDLAFLVREFSTVFLRKNPSDRKVRTYGVKVSKVGLKFAGLLATSQGMKAIMQTGILAKIGISGKQGGTSFYGAEPVGKTPAARLADKVRNYASSKKINTVAVIRTQNGRYVVGRNSGGVTNLEVQNALENIGVNEFQGQCAEVNAISRALNKGVNLEGATISISNVRGPNSTNGLHGTFKQPCSTCDVLIELFNLTVTK
jgi:RHS repeat-associated protein